MMKGELITVTQLPIIVEQLQTIKTKIEEQVKNVLSLECTDETVKEIKSLRAGLTKDFNSLEERRKIVKKTVMEPYDKFELIYRDCVTNIYTDADKTLKKQIDEVENVIKDKKRSEVRKYFNEYRQSKNIDFVSFENAGLNITLSVGVKKLKEQAQSFIDKICDDLTLIDTQEHKDEILYHYKKADSQTFLNPSRAITLVAEKVKAIEDAKRQEEQNKETIIVKQETIEKVNEVLSAPKVEAFTSENAEPENQFLKLQFTVWGTMEQLKSLKDFLIKGGYKYE